MVRRQCIMVVDDDQEILKILNRILELEGFDVVVVADGVSALALMKKNEPDLVILDIMMPELDGFQTLNLLRERSDIPVIMLSARRELASLQKSLFLGADDYVRKPFDTRTLIARIRTKLRRVEQGGTFRGKEIASRAVGFRK